MPSRNEELPLAVEMQQAEEQLHIVDALVIAMAGPGVVLDAVLESEDVDAARAVLRERLGLSEVQAYAVLDMQFRRATKQDRSRIEASRDELRARLDYLTSLDAQPGQ